MRSPDYEIKAYYGNRPNENKRYGDLCMHTWHVGKVSKDIELSAFLGRDDIAYVDLMDCNKHTTERMFKK